MLKVVPDIDLEANPSAFQQAMVQADIFKLLPSQLSSTAFDVLLVDLIDERLRLIKGQDGYYTYSPEAQRCGLDPDRALQVAPGSEEHMEAFTDSLNRMLQIVSPDRIIVNRVFWAAVDVNGNSVASEEAVEANNAILSQLYSLFADVDGIRFIDYPSELIVSDPEHKWGSSPFHFSSDFYDHTIKSLSELTGCNFAGGGHRVRRRGFDPSTLASELAGRALDSIRPVSYVGSSVVVPGGLAADGYSVRTNGNWSMSPLGIVSEFRGDAGVYESTFQFPSLNIDQNGFSIRFLLEGWSAVSYVAVGHVHGGVFRHVKVMHLGQGEWTNVTISFDDLAYGVQNGFRPADLVPIDHIRLFIKGTPDGSNARATVAWCATWLERRQPSGAPLKATSPNNPLASLLVEYVQGTSEHINDQIEVFLRTGRFPMPRGAELSWATPEMLPDQLSKSATYRYIWHSLFFAANLVIYGSKNSDNGATFGGRDLVQQWLDGNYWSESTDPRCAWDDHRTAERLIALLIVQHISRSDGSDYRFMKRLEDAIEGHARLLESASFYAANQISRYHDHAWFQDLALIAASAIGHTSRAGERRIELGIRRLEGQFERLVVREDGYAVFAENSSEYHAVSADIVKLADAVETLVTGGSRFHKLVENLE